MIISASYRTDIPAFYGEWFVNRLKAGYCLTRNPYSKVPVRVDLSRRAVDGIVFWTKNAGPFMKHLEAVRQMGYAMVFQYTITGYPKELEKSVLHAARCVEHFRELAQRLGKQAVVWRYDTILETSLTPYDFHLEKFRELAEMLAGATDEVVVSFAQLYRKTEVNMNKAAERGNFTWHDPPDEKKRELVRKLALTARRHGMQLSICAQRDLIAGEAQDAHCIDARRLSQVSGRPIRARLKGNRTDCGCYAARDIGLYDTCPHGCAYCYAVANQATARKKYKEHDPTAEALTPIGSSGRPGKSEGRHPMDSVQQMAFFEEG